MAHNTFSNSADKIFFFIIINRRDLIRNPCNRHIGKSIKFLTTKNTGAPPPPPPHYVHLTILADTSNGQLVNSIKSFHPDSSNLVNYIVARPDHMDHAEVVLLDRFNELQQKFGRRPSLILIFSWLMPCSECTEAIINRLG